MFKIWINDGTTEMPNDDILYIVSKEGIMLKKKLGLFASLVPVKNISILNEIDTYASMHIEKISARKFANILTFFRKVLEEYGGEGNIILHYNQEKKKYKIEVPKQEVGGASVEYESLVSFKGYERIGTIHSHPTFAASHSGIDHMDETSWDGLHITIGNINIENFSLSVSIMANGTRFLVNPLDYIEGIKFKEYGMWENVYNPKLKAFEALQVKKNLGYQMDVPKSFYKFPKKWLTQVTKHVPLYKDWRDIMKSGTYGLLSSHQGIFDGVGNPIHSSSMLIPDPKSKNPYSDMLHDNFDDEEWNPCRDCPFKDYKSDMMLQELYENLDEDELERLGFHVDEGESTIINGDLTVKNDDVPEHQKQEGFQGKSGK